jgi:hypothetical protein
MNIQAVVVAEANSRSEKALPNKKSYSFCLDAGQLIIHGISSDTLKTNCKVFTDWNDLKPMQNATAKGPGGANDYSNWTYTYNEVSMK